MTTPAQHEDVVPDLGLGEPVVATPHDPVGHHVRAALDRRLRALVRHEPGTRTGEDPEDLHQMRVSVRRMRAVLRSARPLLDRHWADQLRAELGWLGSALGPVRDLDVLLDGLRTVVAGFDDTERAAAETLFAALADERFAARSTMLDALASDRYLALLSTLADAVRRPVPAIADAEPPDMSALVGAEYKRLYKAVRRAGDQPPDPVLHELRIRGKRVRYTAELAEPVLGEPAKALVKATTGMQDVLGAHQDACVAETRVRALLAGLDDAATATGEVGMVAGRIIEHQTRRQAETRAAWPAAWTKVQHAATRISHP